LLSRVKRKALLNRKKEEKMRFADAIHVESMAPMSANEREREKKKGNRGM